MCWFVFCSVLCHLLAINTFQLESIAITVVKGDQSEVHLRLLKAMSNAPAGSGKLAKRQQRKLCIAHVVCSHCKPIRFLMGLMASSHCKTVRFLAIWWLPVCHHQHTSTCCRQCNVMLNKAEFTYSEGAIFTLKKSPATLTLFTETL